VGRDRNGALAGAYGSGNVYDPAKPEKFKVAIKKNKKYLFSGMCNDLLNLMSGD
jgi:hypothetical protein